MKIEKNADVKAIFKQLIESGRIKAHLEGPTDNVLVCDSMNDWIIAGSVFAEKGYLCTSPGGYGGSHPTSRQNTHVKIWKTGSLCASVIEKKFLIFSLKQTPYDYQHIHPSKSKINVDHGQ